MPRAGERATECKRGHDLTLPGARCTPGPGRRGGGACRLCVVETTRAKRGSRKIGPPSRHRGDEQARLAALAAGLKRCPKCGDAKESSEYSKAANTVDGLATYCRTCRARDKRKAYARDHAAVSLRRRAALFGVTVEELRALIEAQQGRCAICAGPCPTGRRLAVDHDHRSGRVRGLLCANCNRAIGLLQDSASLAEAAAAYLRKWESGAASESGMCDTGLRNAH